jgi:predicted DCC family thiol-disulfide oxidoreductase YuxK
VAVELIIDGDCALCQRASRFATRSECDTTVIANTSLNDDDLAGRDLSRGEVDESVWVIDGTRRYGGVDALIYLLRRRGGWWVRAARLGDLAAMHAVLKVLYRLVSRNRHHFSHLARRSRS